MSTLRPVPDNPDRLPWTPTAEEETPSQARPDDERFWSVTTITRTIGTPDGLIGWCAGRTANAAIDDEPIWRAMVERQQRAEAYRYLTGARFRPRPGFNLTDADGGTLFHTLAERWVYDGKRPTCNIPEVEPLLDSFGRWLDIAQPTYRCLEATVYNPEYRYAGTLDAIVSVGGVDYLLDYKTSHDTDDGKYRKRPWSDVALQLAGYRHAQFVATWRSRRYEVHSRRYYLLSADERALAAPMPDVDDGACLHVTPDHCDFYPVSCGLDVFTEGFLTALDAASWVYLASDGAIREDQAVLLDTRRMD